MTENTGLTNQGRVFIRSTCLVPGCGQKGITSVHYARIHALSIRDLFQKSGGQKNGHEYNLRCAKCAERVVGYHQAVEHLAAMHPEVLEETAQAPAAVDDLYEVSCRRMDLTPEQVEALNNASAVVRVCSKYHELLSGVEAERDGLQKDLDEVKGWIRTLEEDNEILSKNCDALRRELEEAKEAYQRRYNEILPKAHEQVSRTIRSALEGSR